MPEKALLNIKNIYKSFGMNAVLKGISLDLNEGEVLALIGGNGAGKSTLMKIIMGIYQQDSGEIYVKGEKFTSNKTSAALANGIYMVPQEPLLFPNMSVEENIEIGFNKKKSELHRDLLEVMKDVGWNLDLDRKASSLSIAEQQMVEILRGLLRHARILILDEPTSALTFDEVESLFKCVEDLKSKGIGIIYITHRLAEVFQIATDVAIMRDGKVPVRGKVSEFTREILVKGLLPPDAQEKEDSLKARMKGVDYTGKKPVFEIQNLSGYGFTDISLKVYPGEILGMAGVVGAGRTELATTVFGKDKVLGGKVILDGKDITGLSTRQVIEAGLNYVPEDRHYHGLFKISDIAANVSSAMLAEKEMGRFFLNKKKEYEMTRKYVDDFRIKITGQDQLVGSLSGGNQQKVVLGKWLATRPEVLILDEPTRGVDVNAKYEIYRTINELAKEGIAIVMISSELPEIINMCDNVCVMRGGRLVGKLTREELSQEEIMKYAAGGVE